MVQPGHLFSTLNRLGSVEGMKISERTNDSRPRRKVCWISAGVSSVVASYLAEDVDDYIYIDVADQHPDSMRFVKDFEKLLDREIQILKSDRFEDVEAVCRASGFINSPHGAPCTGMLKMAVRKHWEQSHKDERLIYVWGFDYSEKKRAERIVANHFEYDHEFPLIRKKMLKADAHAYLKNIMHLKRPAMYDLGYSNNNCIGCVKGGQGYWNQIRIDFPEVFEKRMKMEQELGCSCLNGVFLKDLDPFAGKMAKAISEECSLICTFDAIA